MWSTDQSTPGAAWKLAARQHGVVARGQLLKLGLSRRSIEHRVARGRLHLVIRGVYAVGRPELSRYGRWMAAVLSCGPSAVLSHRSAAALWGIAEEERGTIDLSLRAPSTRARPGIRAHRRRSLRPADLATHHDIPLTSPARTLLDLATCLDRSRVERAVNEADRLDLVNPESLRIALDELAGEPGVARLRELLDRATFRLTDSELERRFLRLASSAALPAPLTRHRVNGFRVDFHWPELGLVVETDGLRYHRTPAQQAADRRRDQAHTAAGLTQLRFTHAQVHYEPDQVVATLISVARRLDGLPDA